MDREALEESIKSHKQALEANLNNPQIHSGEEKKAPEMTKQETIRRKLELLGLEDHPHYRTGPAAAADAAGPDGQGNSSSAENAEK